MSDYTVSADRDGTCSNCKGQIRKGSPITFKKGARKDGTEVNIPVHAHCPPEGQTQTALPPAAPKPDVPTASSEHFVQIAAWVPVERAPAVLAAIKEARGW